MKPKVVRELIIEVAKQRLDLVRHVKLGIRIIQLKLMTQLDRHLTVPTENTIIAETQIMHKLKYGAM